MREEDRKSLLSREVKTLEWIRQSTIDDIPPKKRKIFRFSTNSVRIVGVGAVSSLVKREESQQGVKDLPWGEGRFERNG